MRDPLAPVRRYLKTHGLRELSRQTGVPVMTIHSWLTRGTPHGLEQAMKVIAFVQRIDVKRL